MLYKLCLLLIGWSELANAVYFVAIGDWGTDDKNQKNVAKLMSDWCSHRECDFVVGAGDNFYPNGVVSATDPRFNTTWKNVYDLPATRDLVWYQSLGNHDYVYSREKYQVQYAVNDNQWYMPNLWYDFHRLNSDGSTVHFVVIDSTALVDKLNRPKDQIDFIEKTLSASTDDWKILVDHHPPFTVGGHAPGSSTIRLEVVPLAEKYGVDIFLSAHDHNLQHISKSTGDGIDYVISGAGGKGLYSRDPTGDVAMAAWGYKTNFFGYNYGVVVFEINSEIIKVDYLNQSNGQVEYSFIRHNAH